MTYLANLDGAKTDAELSRTAQPCSCALVSLTLLLRSPVVYSCSDGEDTCVGKYGEMEGLGTPTNAWLPQAKVTFYQPAQRLRAKAAV